MSLIAELTSKQTKLSNADPAWVQFITDYIEHIRKNSSINIIDDASRDRYKNKIYHYLRDNGCNEELHWIALLINDLTDYTDFTTAYSLLLPNLGYITNLYRSFRTSNTPR